MNLVLDDGSAAHPRSRGENRRGGLYRLWDLGSSPLTRGKRLVDDDVRDRRRLIPAHAGKTPTTSSPPDTRAAHPRSRGENAAPTQSRMLAPGSSPLTRGKRRRSLPSARLSRLIPAHAGKTNFRPRIGRSCRAHPRSRGENSHRLGGDEYPEGSSPLTRGKPRTHRYGECDAGLIPAHAGKT